jgi:hypothetical protein
MKKLLLLLASLAFMISSCGPSAAELQAEAELELQIENIELETAQIDQLRQEIENSADELEQMMKDI